MKHTLYCDPSHSPQLTLRYNDTSQLIINPKSEDILEAISTLINNEPLQRIIVVNQAQSFTLIRILATICNTLAYTKNAKLFTVEQSLAEEDLHQEITLLGLVSVKTIMPHYSAEPNIT